MGFAVESELQTGMCMSGFPTASRVAHNISAVLSTCRDFLHGLSEERAFPRLAEKCDHLGVNQILDLRADNDIQESRLTCSLMPGARNSVRAANCCCKFPRIEPENSVRSNVLPLTWAPAEASACCAKLMIFLSNRRAFSRGCIVISLQKFLDI